METITLLFLKDGSVTIQDEPGQNAEKRLKFLLDGLGTVERKGHLIGHKHEAGVQISQGNT